MQTSHTKASLEVERLMAELMAAGKAMSASSGSYENVCAANSSAQADPSASSRPMPRTSVRDCRALASRRQGRTPRPHFWVFPFEGKREFPAE